MPFPPALIPEIARKIVGGYIDFLPEFEDKDELWARATQDPGSISADERRIILRRPSVATEEANVAQVTSSAMGPSLTTAQLITKAAEQPGSLSAEECRLIQNDFHLLSSQRASDRAQAKFKIGSMRYAALGKAQTAVRSQEEKTALNNAHLTGSIRHRERMVELDSQRKILEERLLSPPNWIQKLEAEWGFAFCRCQECAIGDRGFWRWMEYRDDRKRLLVSGLEFVVGGKEAIAKQQQQFIDLIASEEQISEFRQNFRSMRDMGLIKPGILRNTFLLITPECMNPGVDWLWAIDPGWKSQYCDEDGYDGKLKVSWTHLYSWFYMVRSQERLAFKDLWRKAEGTDGIWKVKQKWSSVRDVPDEEFAAL